MPTKTKEQLEIIDLNKQLTDKDVNIKKSEELLAEKTAKVVELSTKNEVLEKDLKNSKDALATVRAEKDEVVKQAKKDAETRIIKVKEAEKKQTAPQVVATTKVIKKVRVKMIKSHSVYIDRHTVVLEKGKVVELELHIANNIVKRQLGAII